KVLTRSQHGAGRTTKSGPYPCVRPVTVFRCAAIQDRTIEQRAPPFAAPMGAMTTVFKSQVLGRAVRSVGVALAFAATFSVLSSTASFAFSAETQQMCSGDAFRLCSAEIPNIPR